LSSVTSEEFVEILSAPPTVNEEAALPDPLPIVTVALPLVLELAVLIVRLPPKFTVLRVILAVSATLLPTALIDADPPPLSDTVVFVKMLFGG